jgi:hypothetical protein
MGGMGRKLEKFNQKLKTMCLNFRLQVKMHQTVFDGIQGSFRTCWGELKRSPNPIVAVGVAVSDQSREIVT